MDGIYTETEQNLTEKAFAPILTVERAFLGKIKRVFMREKDYYVAHTAFFHYGGNFYNYIVIEKDKTTAQNFRFEFGIWFDNLKIYISKTEGSMEEGEIIAVLQEIAVSF